MKETSPPTPYLLVVSDWLRQVIAYLDTAFGLFTLGVLLCAGKFWLDGEVSSNGLFALLGFISFNLVLSQFSLRFPKSSFLLEVFRVFIGNAVLAPLVYLTLNGPLRYFWPVYLMASYFCSAVLMGVPQRPLLWACTGVAYQALLLFLTTWFGVSAPDWANVGIWIGITLVTSVVFAFILNGLKTTLEREAQQSLALRSALEKISEMQAAMVAVSRQAGMAEVASGVLHNVGNMLNSVNISSGLAIRRAKGLRGGELAQVAALLNQNPDGVGNALGDSRKGAQLVEYLDRLGKLIAEDQTELLRELSQIHDNVEHLKHIIHMQQDAAKSGSSVIEEFRIEDVVEDALKLSLPSFQRHSVKVVRQFAELPPVVSDRHKVFQILVNLIANARHAVKGDSKEDRLVTLSIGQLQDGRVSVTVADNGCGISPDNKEKIFSFGFTTKKEGHGFGLHASLLAAKAIHGVLSCQSEGLGKGAAFTLILPANLNKGGAK